MTEQENTPGDLHLLSPWFNVVRRLLSAGHTDGYSILTISVLVDQDGQPVQWTQPQRVTLEPKSNAEAIDGFLRTFGRFDQPAA